MVAVTWSVQIDFSGTAFGGSPTWTDVTTYAMGSQPIRLTYGGQDETGVQPRTCSLLLDNADGRFTPDYASSPYAHPLDVGMRLRVSCVVGGTTYYRFDGFVTDVEASFDGGGPMSTVVVNAQDILGKFGNDTTPLRSLFEETVLAASPMFFYPLTDAAGSTSAGNVTSATVPAAYVQRSKYGGGSYTFGDAHGVPADGTTGLALTGSGTQGYGLVVPAGWTGSVLYGSVHVGFATSAAQAQTLYSESEGANPGLQISLDSSGHVVASKGGGVVFTSVATYNDGKTHFAEYTVGAGVGSTSALNVDGVSVGSGSGVGAVPATYTDLTGYIGSYLGLSQFFSGTVFAVSRTALGNSAFSSAFATGFAGESTDTRFSRLVGFRTNTGSTVGTGQSKAGNQSTAGVTLAEALKQVGDTEGTPVVTDGQGNVVFLSRLSTYTPPSTCTLDASQRQVAADIRYRKDTQVIVNDVTVDRYQASAQRVTDAASQTTYGPRQRSVTTVSYTDRDALDCAGWNVAVGKTAKVRMPSITVDLLTEPTTAVAQSVLASTILGTIATTNLPAVGSPATSMTVLIQGWQEQISPSLWSVSFFTSPAIPKTLYADATNTARNLLDSGLVIAW